MIGEEKFGCYRSGVGVDSVLCTKSYRRYHWRSSEVQSMNAEMDFWYLKYVGRADGETLNWIIHCFVKQVLRRQK